MDERQAGGLGVCPPGSEARRRRSCSTVARRGGTALMLNRCSLRALINRSALPKNALWAVLRAVEGVADKSLGTYPLPPASAPL